MTPTTTSATGPMRFAEVAEVSARLAATSSRREKAAVVAGLLRRLRPDEIGVAVGLLVGQPRQGRVGVGWSTLAKVGVDPAAAPSLTINDVDRWFDELAALTGPGSADARHRAVAGLFGRATDAEQRLLWGVVSGELRHGALGGVLTDAVAAGAEVPVAAVRRAAMLSGDLAEAARVAFTGGADALAKVDLLPGRAVEPMLASPATDVADALDATRTAQGADGAPVSLVEWKLDGARVQVHRHRGEVRLFTRNLNEVTDRLPDVVDLAASLPGGDLVLDGEVAGVAEGERPRAFQDTMGDFGSGAASARGRGLGAFFFDVIHADGVSLVDEPLALRRAELESRVPPSARLESIVTGDPGEAGEFLDDAVARGLEGVMVKSLASPYAAGRRGGTWRKVKPVHTFDLVVLAAEWGHGRRTGWLSNLHLGARGGDAGFVMVGKTFKGLSDELLRWQTETLGELAIGGTADVMSGRGVVHVRPELVVEVAIDGVQRSTRYPGGVALRFARVRRYRDDKTAADADRIEALQALL